VPKSKLLQRPESHDGFVPKHCHHGGKNHALRAKKQDYRYPNIVDGLENVHVASLFLDCDNNRGFCLQSDTGFCW
jgi:hypothetical protein